MGYTLPTFNLPVNIWRITNTVANAPDVTAMGNLSVGHRDLIQAGVMVTTQNSQLQNSWSRMAICPVLLLPKLTDIRPRDSDATFVLTEADCVEVPAGSGRYYCTLGVEDVGKGFGNEHRAALLAPLTGGWRAATLNPWAAPPAPYPLP